MDDYGILSLGDCNTLGAGDCEGNAYPERFGRMIGEKVNNCGFTMSTMREARYFYKDNYYKGVKILTIQYGVVDSWKTFVYSPYVLYYPNNSFRRIARKIVKKYKKICRELGLNEKLGTKTVVPPEEYSQILDEIIQSCDPQTKIILIETVPNLQTFRNQAILEYNSLLKSAAEKFGQCHLVETYDYFHSHMDSLYVDETHINADGHEYIAKKLFETFQLLCQ